MYATVGRVDEPVRFRGELVVPGDSYVREQIDGIEVSADAPAQERGLAKLIWLLWFNMQFGLGFAEPLLRKLVQAIDAGRGIAFQGAEP